MAKRFLLSKDGFPLTVAWLCASVAAFQLAAAFAFTAQGSAHDEVVKVTGLAMPDDDPDELIVHTDRGSYRVDEHLTRGALHGEPWFLFRIGTKYRVTVHERTYGSAALAPSPVILAVCAEEHGKVADLTGTR